MMTPEEILNPLAFIRSVVLSLKPEQKLICNYVLNDPKFSTSPGGMTKHHAYPGGLLVHTAEVLSNCLDMIGYNTVLDRNAIIIAAIWHDYHKIHEYSIDLDGKITSTEYRLTIGHVVGSVLALHKVLNNFDLHPPFIEKVTHIMLAHHGRTEWRSPVEPRIPEAWVLHAADMKSAQG